MSVGTHTPADDQSDKKSDSDVADLDQIRQILMGGYAREIESRFAQLDQQLADSLEKLQTIIVDRTDSISSQLTREVESLHKELDGYRTEGSQAKQALQQNLTSTQNDLQQQIGALGQTLAATEKSIRDEADQGLAAIQDHIREQLEQIRRRMDTEFSRIDNAAVTRKSFRDALRALSIQFDSDDK